jgi:Mrp family chromosome partitioning ATPase/capsular polysaccharide biosynthesis protein
VDQFVGACRRVQPLEGDVVEAGLTDLDEKPGLLESAWKYKMLLVALAVAGMVLGLGFSLLQPTRYEGSANVLLNLPVSASGGVEPGRFVLNQAELMTSQTVLERAVRLSSNRISVKNLRKRLTTESSADRDLVTVKVLDDTPAGARQLADNVTRAYEQVLAAQNRLEAAQLKRQEASLQAQLDKIEGRLKTRPDDLGLRASESAMLGELADLSRERAALETGGDSSRGGVRLREALPAPEQPAQPSTLRNLAAGLLSGLLIGVGLAWWFNGRSETRVTEVDEISSLLGLPILARLPIPSRRRSRGQPVMLEGSETVEAEAFRFLRTSFVTSTRQHEAKVVMVTSATEQEGKSVVTANLALALARAGGRVAVVDLDLRRPAQRRLFDLPDGPGFVEVALGKTKLERALHRLVLVDSERSGSHNRIRGGGNGGEATTSAHVEILTAGTRPKGVGEFVGRAPTSDVIQQLLKRVDVVLIDAPPMLRVGDALSLIPLVDAVLVITRLRVAQRKSLAELRRLLEASSATTLGVVANGVSTEDTWTRPYGQPTRPEAAILRPTDERAGNGAPRPSPKAPAEKP